MKIVYVLSSLNPGGSERQTVEIVRKHHLAGQNATLILPNGGGHKPGNYGPLVAEYGFPVISLETIPDKYTALVGILGKLKPDVVNAVGYPLTCTTMAAAYEVGVSVRVIRYANTGFTRQQFPIPWQDEFVGHAAATDIVGNSQAVADNFDVYHGIRPEQVQVITNGVDGVDIEYINRRDARAHWGVDDDTVLIGQLGNFRLDGLKNQLMTVRAAKRLSEYVTGWQIVLCGLKSEYQYEVAAEIERLQVGEWVKLPGQLTDRALLDGWDVGLNTSHTEGLSNAVQECMARFIPMIVTDCGGNPELITDGVEGYVIPDDDDEALADKLRDLVLHARRRTTMGRKAADRMADHHNWRDVMQQWNTLYKERLAQCNR